VFVHTAEGSQIAFVASDTIRLQGDKKTLGIQASNKLDGGALSMAEEEEKKRYYYKKKEKKVSEVAKKGKKATCHRFRGLTNIFGGEKIRL
jgi:hypothetical protein